MGPAKKKTFREKAAEAFQNAFWKVVAMFIMVIAGAAWMGGKSSAQEAMFNITAQAPVVKDHARRLDSIEAHQERTDAKVDNNAAQQGKVNDAMLAALGAIIESNPKAQETLKKKAAASKKGKDARDLILGGGR